MTKEKPFATFLRLKAKEVTLLRQKHEIDQKLSLIWKKLEPYKAQEKETHYV